MHFHYFESEPDMQKNQENSTGIIPYLIATINYNTEDASSVSRQQQLL